MKLLSDIDDKPPFSAILTATLQWFIVLMPSALIYGMIVAPMLYTDPVRQMQVLQVIFVVTGVCQLLQVTIGHRLPIGTGPTGILIIGVGAGLAFSTNAIYTSMIICGIAIVLLAAIKAHHLLKRLFTFNIILAVLLMSCFAVSPMILTLIIPASSAVPATNYLVFAIIFTLLILGLSCIVKGMAKQLLLPGAIVLGVALYWIFFPFSPTVVSTAPLGLFGSVAPTGFEFSLPLIFAFLFCYFTLLVVDFSAIESMELLLKPSGMDSRFRRGMAVTGLSSILAGFGGSIGCANSNFSMNVILANRHASRYPLAGAGILFLVMGCSPLVVSTLMAIPALVIGCLFIFLLGGMFAATLSLAKERSGGIGYNSGIVIGISLIFAILIAFLPVTTKTLMSSRIEPVLANAFIVGIFSALVMEHIFFRGRAEREEHFEEIEDRSDETIPPG